MKIAYVGLVFLFIACSLQAQDHRTCWDIYRSQAKSGKFSDELSMIKALANNNFMFSGPFIKAKEQIEKLPWPLEYSVDILRIGFNEQIFCNPWPLKLNDIFRKLKNGEFSNSLKREIINYQQTDLDFSNDALLRQVKSNFLSLQKEIEQLKSPFPKEINFRNTNSQDFTSNFFYLLNPLDGKIYIKPNFKKKNKADIIKFGVIEHHRAGEKLGNRTEWNLYNGNGGPRLKANRKITQFAVQSEIVVAVDNKGQFYIFKPTEHKTPTKWATNIGCPVPKKLFLPDGENRWSFSVSVKIKPDERRTIEFMHEDDIVHYYEDADNKKIDFGFTATVYVLAKNGRAIRYWDTGLPASFSRAFTTPNRGNFVVHNLSAAGSTIMVIGTNAQGQKEIYTRMFDYEINGACPGELHTYCKTKAPPHGKILGLLEAWRKLPLPGWRKMPPIKLLKGDFLSNQISMELNGQGNAARLVKVVGVKAGQPGIFQKMIDAEQWDFIPFKKPNNHARSILEKSFKPKLESTLPFERNDMDYEGKILKFSPRSKRKNNVIKKIELKNFHYYLGADEPATLKITTKNNYELSFNFHTNDAWILTAPMKRREFLIGQKNGEPKALVGTLILPESYKNSTQDEIKAVLELFKPFHMKMNAFDVLATDENVVIKSVETFIDLDDDFKTISLREFVARFNRDSGPGYFEKLIMNDRYLIKPSSSVEQIKELIGKNQQLLKGLEILKIDLNHEHKKNNLLTKSANVMFFMWKRGFSFVDKPVTHSLRKFLHHGDLQELMPKDSGNYDIEKELMKVRDRINVYKSSY